jgi:NADH-quinone oxidoreductase subunit C
VSSPEENFLTTLKSKYPDLVTSSDALDRKKISVVTNAENLYNVALALRDDFGFTHPSACGAVDYPNENRMQLIYYIMNPRNKLLLFLRVDISRNDPHIKSLTPVWEAMSFHEREAREMFGIDFIGHPNPTTFLLPPDWKGGYPLRKDFKGEGIE